MSLNDFAIQLYLTLLAIAAAPIFLSWGLRRIAGSHASPDIPPSQAELDAAAVARRRKEEDSYWYQYDMGLLPESPHD